MRVGAQKNTYISLLKYCKNTVKTKDVPPPPTDYTAKMHFSRRLYGKKGSSPVNRQCGRLDRFNEGTVKYVHTPWDAPLILTVLDRDYSTPYCILY